MSKEQANVVWHLESSEDHTFVTGKAGAGKTHVLRHFQYSTRKNVAVCAPTGIAALTANGSTVHNLLGLGTSIPADSGIDMWKVRAKRKWIKELDVLVIDEISMVSSDLMDAIDRQLQGIRENHDPFGGLQIVMFGDIYQLPPVIPKEHKDYYKHQGYRSEWFFDAHVWEDTDGFDTFELQEIHRQADPTFINLLNGVRDGTIVQDDLNLLNALGMRKTKTDKAMLLGSRRLAVAEHNQRKLKKLKGGKTEYKARVNTGFGRMEPADRVLSLKPGARIMMLTNDRTDRWVNGSQGVVRTCADSFIHVDLDDGQSHTVERAAWVKAGTPPEEFKDAPKYHQFPMKLAWGVTIHKSQGLSLPEIDVDLGAGAFSAGQTYVALSRVTDPAGLYISSPLSMADIKVDPNVKRFFTALGKV